MILLANPTVHLGFKPKANNSNPLKRVKPLFRERFPWAISNFPIMNLL
jgi:hypothetical protein